MKEKGITLVTLVITIIVMLILAGVVINVAIGDNGIFNASEMAKIETKKAEYVEQVNFIIAEAQIEIYKEGKGSVKELVINKVQERSWCNNITQIDENNIEIQTNDNFKIGVVFRETNIQISYINFKEEKPNEPDLEHKKVKIIYYGNGGILNNKEETITLEVEENSTIILPNNSFTFDMSYQMYEFLAWVDNNGNEYQPGEEYKVDKNEIKFSAKWEYKIKEELPYLITTGNQYIDTGYVANQDTSLEMQFQLLSTKSQLLYGARVDTKKDTYSVSYGSEEGLNKGIRSDYGNTQKSIQVNEKEKYTIKQEKNNFYINGELAYTHMYSNFTAGGLQKNNVILFNANTNGTITNQMYYAELKFYYCKIWDENTLIREFIPVVDNKDKICLYDKVGQRLYYAQYGESEEEFRAGDNNKHIELKALSCKGNQYIDTQIKPNQDTVVEMKYKIEDTAKSQALYGVRTEAKSKTFTCFFLEANKTIRCDYNIVQTNIGAITSGKANIVKQNKNIFYLNNVQKGSATYSDFSCDYNLYLFAVNTKDVQSLEAYLDFYYCKIWDGNRLIRDFIPVLDNNNKVCLYDKMESKYYYSKNAEFLLSESYD